MDHTGVRHSPLYYVLLILLVDLFACIPSSLYLIILSVHICFLQLQNTWIHDIHSHKVIETTINVASYIRLCNNIIYSQ